MLLHLLQQIALENRRSYERLCPLLLIENGEELQKLP
jgi:hypothetical protein